MTQLNEVGLKVYAALRRDTAKGNPRQRTAAECYALALKWQDSGRANYPGRDGTYSIWTNLAARNGQAFACAGESRVIWVESPESKGLRFVGLAADLVGLDYSGWDVGPSGCLGTARGVVYLLPAKNGKTRALAAIADPVNSDDDGEGPALVSLDIVECEDGDEAIREAARRADRFAELYAESENEYSEAWHAGQRAREKSADAVAAAYDWKVAVRELRAAFKSRHSLPPGEARATVKSLIDLVRARFDAFIEARDLARELRSDIPQWHIARKGWLDGYASV